MERVYIQWTVVNWITVFLMAALGYALLGFVSQLWLNRGQSNA